MKEIVTPLLSWFKQNKRDLEWRKDPTPYTVLISEVMLQQTRVETVRSYFQNFIKELPNFEALAQCPEDKLLKLWEGLGYYSRVRNLKKCAIQVTMNYQGIFPKNFEEAIKLPGVGMYTCGAVLSIAYHLKYAAVDGNVLRVLSRYTTSSKDILQEKTKLFFKTELEKIMPNEAGAFNESLMELGATICMPKITLCHVCPIQTNCKAYLKNVQLQYPVKAKPKDKKIFEYTCLFLTDGKKYLLQPKENHVLKGLASPILVEQFLTPNDAINYVEDLNFTVKNITELKEKKHVFTHQVWYMKGYLVLVKDLLSYPNYPKEEIIEQVSIPTCFKKFFEEIF